MDDRFVDQGTMRPIKNGGLVCSTCKKMIPKRTDICKHHQQCKPLKVLKGGKCEFYEQTDGPS